MASNGFHFAIGDQKHSTRSRHSKLTKRMAHVPQVIKFSGSQQRGQFDCQKAVAESYINFQNVSSQTLLFKIRTTAPEKFQVIPTYGLVSPSRELKAVIRVSPMIPLRSVAYEKFQVLVMIAPPELFSQKEVAAKLDTASPSEKGTSMSQNISKLWHKFSCPGSAVEKHCVNVELDLDTESMGSERSSMCDYTENLSPVPPPNNPPLQAQLFPDQCDAMPHKRDGESELEAQAKALLTCRRHDICEIRPYTVNPNNKSLLRKVEEIERSVSKLEESSCHIMAWTRRTIIISIILILLILLLNMSGSGIVSSDSPCSKSFRKGHPSKMFVRWDNLL